jgi:hypothetical protein
MKALWPARFFAVVRLHPPYTLAILAAIVGVGLWTTSTSPGELDSGLGMLLFVQMFLASSGFLVRARRGHFDPLLLGAGDRTSALVWHWLVSIAPGVAGWTCLAGAGYVMGSPAAVSAFVGVRAVALFIVSALAWTAGFALTRGAAGVMWMAALLGLLVRHAELLGTASTLATSSGIVLRHAAALMICPFLLVGNRPVVAPSAVWAAGLVSAVLLLCVWRLSGGLDIYLVDRA